MYKWFWRREVLFWVCCYRQREATPSIGFRLGDLKGEVAIRREEKPLREEIIMASQICCHNTLIKTDRW